MLVLKTLHACRDDLCEKLLDSILNDEEHKIRYLLPAIVTAGRCLN